jgi:hypothetical protein
VDAAQAARKMDGSQVTMSRNAQVKGFMFSIISEFISI